MSVFTVRRINRLQLVHKEICTMSKQDPFNNVVHFFGMTGAGELVPLGKCGAHLYSVICSNLSIRRRKKGSASRLPAYSYQSICSNVTCLATDKSWTIIQSIKSEPKNIDAMNRLYELMRQPNSLMQ